MKRIFALMLAAFLLISVCGCGKGSDKDDIFVIDPNMILPAEITCDYVHNNDEYATYSMTLKALDENGGVMWEYTSPDCYVGQCETIQYLGMEYGLVYISENAICRDSSFAGGTQVSGGRIRALNADDGSVAWDNTGFNGSGASAAFDSKGNIFVAGYFGPDCMKIDHDGNTVWTVPYVDQSFYWIYDLSYEDGIITISYEMNEFFEADSVRLDSDGNLLDEADKDNAAE